MLQNASSIAKIGFDTAENEPFKVCPLSAYRPPRWVEVALVSLSLFSELESVPVAAEFVRRAELLTTQGRGVVVLCWYRQILGRLVLGCIEATFCKELPM